MSYENVVDAIEKDMQEGYADPESMKHVPLTHFSLLKAMTSQTKKKLSFVGGIGQV